MNIMSIAHNSNRRIANYHAIHQSATWIDVHLNLIVCVNPKVIFSNNFI